jgi:prepilin signal peptidase PulO-like enzyme (type II secretory pathway)
MANSKSIAGLLGPVLIAIAITEAVNLRMLISFIGQSHAPLVYLNGTLLFVAGLSIVRAHNHWTRSWPVLVTLVGWLVLLFGLARMFAPVSVQEPARSATGVYALLVVALSVGVFLTFKAYGPDDAKVAASAG